MFLLSRGDKQARKETGWTLEPSAPVDQILENDRVLSNIMLVARSVSLEFRVSG